MKILSNNKKVVTKYLGASLPLDIVNYVVLFTIAKGISKTYLLKSQLNKWQRIQRKKESCESLLCELSKRITRQWLVEKRKNMIANPAEFKRGIRLELTSKGLSENHINTILSNIKIK